MTLTYTSLTTKYRDSPGNLGIGQLPLIGVASYGTLGHVPPRFSTVYFVEFILELQKV